MKKQNAAFKEVAIQSTRPFLLPVLPDVGVGEPHVRVLTSLESQFKIDSVEVRQTFQMVLKNSGKLPANLEGTAFGLISPEVWYNTHDSDVVKLARYIESKPGARLSGPDYTLFADSLRILKPNPSKYSFIFPTQQPESICVDTITHFPCWYIKYSDPYNNRYDILLLVKATFERRRIPNVNRSDIYEIERIDSLRLERIAWDLLYNDQVTIYE